MYGYYSFYSSLIVFSIVSLFLSFFVNPWYGLLGNIPLIIYFSNRFRGFRVRCRTYPGITLCKRLKWWLSAEAPKSEDALKDACKTEVTFVGNAWSFFLDKNAPVKPVFTYNFSSLRPDENGFWKSGTLIKAVAKYYENKNKAFPSLPSYQNITLGGWIMTESHGSSGDDGESSSSRFSAIRYILKSDRNKVHKDMWGTFKEIKKEEICLILSIKFDLRYNSENILLHKRRVRSIDEWLKQGAYQRACFIGKQRDVMIRWERPEKQSFNLDLNSKKRTKTFISEEKDWDLFLEEGRKKNKFLHKDPHCCSRFCLWFQADICTAVYIKWFCLFTEGAQKYESIVHLAEVNRFVPQIYPIFTVFLQQQVNFEKIIKKTDEAEVKYYYERIKEFHNKYGGRTEIRYGNWLFIDVSIPISLVKEYSYIVPKGSYHLGKYQPKQTSSTLLPNSKTKLKL